MPLLAIVYFSISGTTEKLAHAVARGADGMAEIALCRITGDDIVSGRFQNEGLLETIDRADAVAFGSPTYMGGPAAQFKAFADASSDRWSRAAMGQQDRGRLYDGRVRKRRSTPHTDLLFHSGRAARHALVRTGYSGWRGSGRPNRLGSQLGLATHLVDGALPQSDLGTAEYLGQRLAKMAGATANDAVIANGATCPPKPLRRRKQSRIYAEGCWIASLRSE